MFKKSKLLKFRCCSEYNNFAILFTINKLINLCNNTNCLQLWEHRAYNFHVKNTKKSFGQSFVDYLGPTYFNQMPTLEKKIIHKGKANGKKVVYK